MRPGDRLTLRIDKAVAGGRMLARHEGAIVLVAAAIPGETVEAEVEKVQRGTIWAATRRVLDASGDRVEPFCEPACGGSVYAHVRYQRQLALKREIVRDAFARLARMPVGEDLEVSASPPEGFRMRARLHVRERRLGFFREGTHDLCDPGPTRQLLPATIAALNTFADALENAAGDAIDEVVVAENCEASERALHLELARDADPSRLASLATPGVDGVSCRVANSRRALTLAGSPYVTDTVAGVPLRRHARAFFQGNRYLLQPLVDQVSAMVVRGRVLDLYAGVGLFSAALAARGDTTVIAIEGDHAAAEDLKWNLQRFRGVAEGRHQSVELFVAARARDVQGATIVVDPPRTGMSKDALAGVLALNPTRIVYVSCDVATLARDVGAAAARGYRLASLRAFDMFPHTAHVECVAVVDS